jgi:hypothetical protein
MDFPLPDDSGVPLDVVDFWELDFWELDKK